MKRLDNPVPTRTEKCLLCSGKQQILLSADLFIRGQSDFPKVIKQSFGFG
jgi:hypothetical protein